MLHGQDVFYGLCNIEKLLPSCGCCVVPAFCRDAAGSRELFLRDEVEFLRTYASCNISLAACVKLENSKLIPPAGVQFFSVQPILIQLVVVGWLSFGFVPAILVGGVAALSEICGIYLEFSCLLTRRGGCKLPDFHS